MGRRAGIGSKDQCTYSGRLTKASDWRYPVNRDTSKMTTIAVTNDVEATAAA
jgi:hypothetical protein